MTLTDRSSSAPDIERVTRSIGRRLVEGSTGWRSWIRLDEKLIALVMATPALRVNLFRFTEAFPAMNGPRDTLDHLVEYLGDPVNPRWVRVPVAVAARMPFGDRIAHWIATFAIGRMAKQFIAGRTAEEAVSRVHSLWNKGVGVVVDALGEKTITDAEADRYAMRVLDLVEGLGSQATHWQAQPQFSADRHGPLPRVAIAIKPTALSARFTPLKAETGIAEVSRRLEPVLEAATNHDVMVWFDMEQYAVKDMTHELFRRISSNYPTAHLGIVVQAYLRDSYDDLRHLLEWTATRETPIGIRLVKGAYWDYETVVARSHGWPVPVYEHKVDTDANYERCSELLNAHVHNVRPAYASHNLRSLAHAIAGASIEGRSVTDIEVQTLQGMASDIPATLTSLDVRTRVYIPVGELIPGMSYLVRRLLENTSNESFVRQQQSGKRTVDDLLQRPLATNDDLMGEA